MSVLCLGESLVDLFCERPVAAFEEANAFVPHSGGGIDALPDEIALA